MFIAEEEIFEITLELTVESTPQHLEIPVPFDYDGAGILTLVVQDLSPASHDASNSSANRLDAPACEIDDGSVLVTGAMDPETFEEWCQRAEGLQEIDLASSDLEDAGLLPGTQPGIDDERTLEPTTLMLDETIEHDLHNARITANQTKAAFRCMREACGASQAALADALGVNARAVKRWETPGQPEPPYDARRLVEAWHADALAGANWHVRQAQELREDCHEAYTLVIYRNQEEFDRALAPLLAQAPSFRWQDALAEAREHALQERGDDSWLEVEHAYTNFPGTRSYWRANAAARMAATLMSAQGIPYGYAYPNEQQDSLFWEGVWVPRADVQRIESAGGAVVVCGMR